MHLKMIYNFLTTGFNLLFSYKVGQNYTFAKRISNIGFDFYCQYKCKGKASDLGGINDKKYYVDTKDYFNSRIVKLVNKDDYIKNLDNYDDEYVFEILLSDNSFIFTINDFYIINDNNYYANNCIVNKIHMKDLLEFDNEEKQIKYIKQNFKLGKWIENKSDVVDFLIKDEEKKYNEFLDFKNKNSLFLKILDDNNKNAYNDYKTFMSL
jgi:hypothetical protein